MQCLYGPCSSFFWTCYYVGLVEVQFLCIFNLSRLNRLPSKFAYVQTVILSCLPLHGLNSEGGIPKFSADRFLGPVLVVHARLQLDVSAWFQDEDHCPVCVTHGCHDVYSMGFNPSPDFCSGSWEGDFWINVVPGVELVAFIWSIISASPRSIVAIDTALPDERLQIADFRTSWFCPGLV